MPSIFTRITGTVFGRRRTQEAPLKTAELLEGLQSKRSLEAQGVTQSMVNAILIGMSYDEISQEMFQFTIRERLELDDPFYESVPRGTIFQTLFR